MMTTLTVRMTEEMVLMKNEIIIRKLSQHTQKIHGK